MTHYQILMDIINHPKPHHVLVEKPLCTTVADCKKVATMLFIIFIFILESSGTVSSFSILILWSNSMPLIFFFFYIYSTMNHPPLWIQEEAFIIVIHQMNDVNYVAIEDSCVFVKNLFVLNPQNAKTHDVNKNMITCKEGIKVRKGLFLLLVFNACWCLFFSSLKYLINFVMFWK